MKILMIAPEPIFQPRGTPLSVVGRLKALSDMGHQVDLLTYSMGQTVNLPGIHFLRIPAIPGIKKIKIGPSLTKIPLDLCLMLKTFRQLMRKRYDLIHTHEEAGFWGIVASLIFRIPHIYDMHSSLPQQLRNFQFTQSRILITLFQYLERWVLKTASAVITICPDLQNHVLSLLPGKQSVLIENVIDYGTIFGQVDRSGQIREHYHLKGKKVVLYAGTFEPYQGIDLLIQSAVSVVGRNPKVIFMAVGGHADQVNYYQHKVNRAGLQSSFVFTGQVLPQEVNSYVQCADVLVSPRKSGTNTPLKIYSYLRSGLPIVATRLWTHTQVLDDGVAILVDAAPDALAGGIEAALKPSVERNRMIIAAGRLAEEKYSVQVYKKKFANVLELALRG